MKIAIIVAVILLISASNVYAISSSISSNKIINGTEEWIIEDDTSIINNARITNYGKIVIKGELINNAEIENFGLIVIDDTFINNKRLINNGYIHNIGIFTNNYIISNLNIINNTNTLNNNGYIFNIGRIVNSTGTANDDEMRALFPSFISGKIDNNGHIFDIRERGKSSRPISNTNICELSLDKTLINLGEKITASVNTNSNTVRFIWSNQVGIERDVTKSALTDEYTPTSAGNWQVKAECGNASDSETFEVSFNVLSEYAIGILASLITMSSILFFHLRRLF
ncbi:MAG: hypothetical protein QXO37_05045 [Candidatus Nitrosocaldaceae archaeon]